MNKADNENIKNDLKPVQEKVISTIQAISKLTMAQIFTPNFLRDRMEEIVRCAEDTCVSARNTVEKYRLLYSKDEKLKFWQKTATNVSGELEVTAEGWVHIRLSSLLPHCKYKAPYLEDTLSRLVREYEKPLPKFEKAFMAIVEYCDYDSRTVYDQDNKGWKIIPNIFKGRVFEDDDQFHLDIGLFSKHSSAVSCHIYILPETQINDFIYYLSKNLL